MTAKLSVNASAGKQISFDIYFNLSTNLPFSLRSMHQNEKKILKTNYYSSCQNSQMKQIIFFLFFLENDVHITQSQLFDDINYIKKRNFDAKINFICRIYI